MKVYVVNEVWSDYDGLESDSTIHGVFTRLEDAQRKMNEESDNFFCNVAPEKYDHVEKTSMKHEGFDDDTPNYTIFRIEEKEVI